MLDAPAIPLGMAFLAGLVSFLSPCVLPIVPAYLSFVTGVSLRELRTSDEASQARKRAAINASLFITGFLLLFIALGASASAIGEAVRSQLPLVQQIGGAVIIVFGLVLLGVLKVPALMREKRFVTRGGGAAGALLAGVAFGAGWTPCIGPILASILLYAGLEATMGEGMLLLGVYALGLGLPFLVAALAFDWFVSRTTALRRWLLPLERAAGAFLVVIGTLLLTGRFARLSSFFAGFGQLFNLEI